MKEIRIKDARLQQAASEGMDAFVEVFVNAINEAIEGQLTTETMSEVMPTKIPNLLVNGGNGIAVGMATNMPTHNLGEVIDGCCAYIDNPDIDTEGLMQYIPAPDFPTGGFIYGLQGVKDAYETGRGRIVMRAKAI